MSEEDRFSITAKFERNLILCEGNSVRYLVIDIESHAAKNSYRRRHALNIALAIDSSTSMRGRPMASAKKAAINTIESLSDKDSLSIVSFAADARMHLSGVKMNPAGKKEAIAQVEQIEHRLYTNISDGWLRAAECVAKVMTAEKNTNGHLMLLSDGHANHGILDPAIMGQHAEELRKRNVYTSTVGIGDYYTASLLQGLAERGGGRMHDAQYPDEIVEVINGELSELKSIYAEDVSVELRYQAPVSVESLSRFPVSDSETSLISYLGSMGPGSKKTLVIRVFTPPGNTGQSLLFAANVKGKIPESGSACKTKDAALSLSFADYTKNKNQQKCQDTAFRAARAWQASVVQRAVELNRNGEIRELKSFLDHEIKCLSRFIHDLNPLSRHLLAELEQLARNAEKPWRERLRKEMQSSSYRMLTNTGDYRKIKREPWTTTFSENESG